MFLDDFNHLLQVVVWVGVVVETVRQFFQGLEEAVEVHLVVVTAANHILVDYVIVRLHNVTVRQAWVLGESLELR